MPTFLLTPKCHLHLLHGLQPLQLVTTQPPTPRETRSMVTSLHSSRRSKGNSHLSSRKPQAGTNMTKGAASSVVTKDGTYDFRALKLWFEEHNCIERTNIGTAHSSINSRANRLTTISEQGDQWQAPNNVSGHLTWEWCNLFHRPIG